MKNRNTVIITGANGFIGTELAKYFLERGWFVRALQRRYQESEHANLSYHAFELPSGLDPAVFQGVDFVIHCAVQPFDARHKNSDEINIRGTQFILDLCRANKARMVFLSSLSAHKEAQSHYGKHKEYLESIFDLQKDLVLKPGLVLGRGGLFNKILRIVKKSKIIPLIGGGRQPIQTIAVNDLCAIIAFGMENNISGLYKIAEDKSIQIKDLYCYTAETLRTKSLFISVPLYPLLLLCRLAESANLRLPFTSENILGLKYLRSFETTEDLKKFEIKIKNYRETIDLLCKEGDANC